MRLNDRQRAYLEAIRRWASTGVLPIVLTDDDLYSLVHLVEREVDAERNVYLPLIERMAFDLRRSISTEQACADEEKKP